jgi:hypothetical protein
VAQKHVVLLSGGLSDNEDMSRHHRINRDRKEPSPLPDDLFFSPAPWPFPGRPPRHDLETWTVTDDWPQSVPVTDAEVDVFEAWFGDFFDAMFGPCR